MQLSKKDKLNLGSTLECVTGAEDALRELVKADNELLHIMCLDLIEPIAKVRQKLDQIAALVDK
jgi:hypothetical protein